MKSLKLIIYLLLIPILLFSQKHPKELEKYPDINFKPVKPSEFTLSNGIKVYFLENKELPLVSFTGFVRTGNLYEPAEKTGLSQIITMVMRSGGSKKYEGKKVDSELEAISSTFEIMPGMEYTNFTAECLKNDLSKVLDIVSDVVMNPEFPQEKIDLARNQTKENVRRRWDQPNFASNFLFNEIVYGKDIAYGKRSNYKTLAGISRQDLIDFHKKYYVPNNLTLAVSGNITQSEAKKELEAAFKAWKKKDVSFPKIPSLTEKADGSIYYASQNTPQANIFLGHLGVKRNNPDQYKIEIMNTILGGGFSARLMKELRSNRGLTYGIRGGVQSGKDKGLFVISSQLKAEKCVEAMGLIKDIIKDMQNNPVSDEEFDRAKNSIMNSFVFRFDPKDRYLMQYVNYMLDGYSDEYLDDYIDNIKKVTKADVQEAAKKYMNPEKMVFVIVGDEKRFDKPLSSFAKVNQIEIKKIKEDEQAE